MPRLWCRNKSRRHGGTGETLKTRKRKPLTFVRVASPCPLCSRRASLSPPPHLLTSLLQRRNQQNPLWNDVIIAGPNFLGFVDKIGTTFCDDFIATGFGSYLSLPILRNK